MAAFYAVWTWPTNINEVNSDDSWVIIDGAIFLTKIGGKPYGPAEPLDFI